MPTAPPGQYRTDEGDSGGVEEEEGRRGKGEGYGVLGKRGGWTRKGGGGGEEMEARGGVGGR